MKASCALDTVRLRNKKLSKSIRKCSLLYVYGALFGFPSLRAQFMLTVHSRKDFRAHYGTLQQCKASDAELMVMHFDKYVVMSLLPTGFTPKDGMIDGQPLILQRHIYERRNKAVCRVLSGLEGSETRSHRQFTVKRALFEHGFRKFGRNRDVTIQLIETLVKCVTDEKFSRVASVWRIARQVCERNEDCELAERRVAGRVRSADYEHRCSEGWDCPGGGGGECGTGCAKCKEAKIEQRWNDRAGETGDLRENLPTSGIFNRGPAMEWDRDKRSGEAFRNHRGLAEMQSLKIKDAGRTTRLSTAVAYTLPDEIRALAHASRRRRILDTPARRRRHVTRRAASPFVELREMLRLFPTPPKERRDAEIASCKCLRTLYEGGGGGKRKKFLASSFPFRNSNLSLLRAWRRKGSAKWKRCVRKAFPFITSPRETEFPGTPSSVITSRSQRGISQSGYKHVCWLSNLLRHLQFTDEMRAIEGRRNCSHGGGGGRRDTGMEPERCTERRRSRDQQRTDNCSVYEHWAKARLQLSHEAGQTEGGTHTFHLESDPIACTTSIQPAKGTLAYSELAGDSRVQLHPSLLNTRSRRFPFRWSLLSFLYRSELSHSFAHQLQLHSEASHTYIALSGIPHCIAVGSMSALPHHEFVNVGTSAATVSSNAVTVELVNHVWHVPVSVPVKTYAVVLAEKQFTVWTQGLVLRSQRDLSTSSIVLSTVQHSYCYVSLAHQALKTGEEGGESLYDGGGSGTYKKRAHTIIIFAAYAADPGCNYFYVYLKNDLDYRPRSLSVTRGALNFPDGQGQRYIIPSDIKTREVTSGREICDCEYQAAKGADGRLDYSTRCVSETHYKWRQHIDRTHVND
ncbi:hypothetical protein PR048_032703 [Dryococelus australis]|uniref:Uncharacterized protein n=1 Tax=Dryococelus australis TaxID=614101 RepID=A0ABQ9G2Z3_9NEOP|nr:hypothetical protein PR048_032703 [Dryococelus australis]